MRERAREVERGKSPWIEKKKNRIKKAWKKGQSHLEYKTLRIENRKYIRTLNYWMKIVVSFLFNKKKLKLHTNLPESNN